MVRRTQVSEVDPDARQLSKNGQIAVDDKSRLIAATDLVQDGNDSRQLEPMMTQVSEAIDSEGLVGLADAGYVNGGQLKGCVNSGIKLPHIYGRKRPHERPNANGPDQSGRGVPEAGVRSGPFDAEEVPEVLYHRTPGLFAPGNPVKVQEGRCLELEYGGT